MKEEIQINDLERSLSEIAGGISPNFSPLLDQGINLCCSDIALQYAQKNRVNPELMKQPISNALEEMGVKYSWEHNYLYITNQRLRITVGTDQAKETNIVLPLRSSRVQRLDYLRLIANALSLPLSKFSFVNFIFEDEEYRGSDWSKIWGKAIKSNHQNESKNRLDRILEELPNKSILWMAPNTLSDSDFRGLVCGVLKERNHILRTLDASYLTKHVKVSEEQLTSFPRNTILYLARTVLGHDLDLAVPACQERDNLSWLADSFRSRIKKSFKIFEIDDHINRESSSLNQRLALYKRASLQALLDGKTSEWVMYADSCIYKGVSLLNYIRLKGGDGIIEDSCLSGIDEVIQDIVQC